MLSNKNINQLRRIANQEPLLSFNIGKNLVDENIIKMLNNALTAHEIIKINFLKSSLQLAEREALILDLLSALHADLVQKVGNVIIIYRHSQKVKNPIILE